MDLRAMTVVAAAITVERVTRAGEARRTRTRRRRRRCGAAPARARPVELTNRPGLLSIALRGDEGAKRI
jgi:hypothetical protein